MNAGYVNNASSGYAVIPFFITAAIFFLVFSILLFATGNEILGHYFQPKVLAIVHTLALGWGTMIIMGAAYQLVPVIFETNLKYPTLSFLSYILLTLGTSLLVYCFWFFKTNFLLILAGSLITLSSYLYFIIVWLTSKDTDKNFEFNLYWMLSAFWFCFTTTVGLLLAINLVESFMTKSHLDILKLHAHAGFIGWFLQLILGAAAKMIPMFLLGKSDKKSFLFISIILINVGLLLFLVDAYRNQISFFSLIFGGIIFLGFISWLIFIIDCFKNRLRKKVDIPMKHTFISFACLINAFLTSPLVIQYESGNWVTLYGTWIFLGWITGIILGMTFKTLPFIIWNLAYKNLNGNVKVPLPKDLYSSILIKIQYYLFLISLSITVSSIIFKIRWMIDISTGLWILLSVCYLLNVFKVIIHKPNIQHGN